MSRCADVARRSCRKPHLCVDAMPQTDGVTLDQLLHQRLTGIGSIGKMFWTHRWPHEVVSARLDDLTEVMVEEYSSIRPRRWLHGSDQAQ
jgi:hypothetical protein